MSVFERARAFALIADHLPEGKRAEVAESIAAELMPRRVQDWEREAPGLWDDVQPVDLSPSSTLASFLVDKGFRASGLVRATARMTSWIAQELQPIDRAAPERYAELVARVYAAHELELLEQA